MSEPGRRSIALHALSLVGALAAILFGMTATAAGMAGAENRVGAISRSVEVPVGPQEHIAAGQRLGNDGQRVVVVVATGVATKGADEAGALVRYDPEFASRNLLGQLGEGYARTPSGYTVSAHAAERIVSGAPGRSPTTLSRVDDILNNPTRSVTRPDGSIRVFQG